MGQPPTRRAKHTANNIRAESGSDLQDKNADSSWPEFLIVGRIIRAHGVRGEVGMKIVTDYPERLQEIGRLYIGPNYEPYHVKRIRSHRGGMLVQFEEIKDRDVAEALRGMLVHVHLDDAVPLGEGEHYLFQLEGIRVVTDTGEELGRMTGVIETGANDVYIITHPDGREILLPAIPDVIKQVDTSAGLMTVHILEGLV